MKHTPGPWHSTDDGEICGPRPIERIAIMCRSKTAVGQSNEVHANARLIAAAPDLLAALRFIAAVMDGTREECHEPAALAAARAAIAKAEGKS